MRELDFEKSIARLDGFLSGVAALSGKIRDYTAFSYVVALSEKDCSVEESIKSYFNWLPGLEFSNIQTLDYGLRDLEIEIRSFLVRDTLQASLSDPIDLQKYLSFRVMEEISSAIGNGNVIQVIKLVAISEPFSSDSVFFCICLEDLLIVLQFNDDVKFKAAR